MFPDDVIHTAWAISARHFSRGQRDATLMIAEAIVQEREKWAPAKDEAARQPELPQPAQSD